MIGRAEVFRLVDEICPGIALSKGGEKLINFEVSEGRTFFSPLICTFNRRKTSFFSITIYLFHVYNNNTFTAFEGKKRKGKGTKIKLLKIFVFYSINFAAFSKYV